MKVTVKFTPEMSRLTKTDQAVVDLDENAHLSDLLKVLVIRYGESLTNLLYMPEHDSIEVWPSLIVQGLVISLPLTPNSDVKIKDGSLVVLMTPATGG